METQCDDEASPGGHGDEIAVVIYLREPEASFEFDEGFVGFLAVAIFAVDDLVEASAFTDFDRFRDHGDAGAFFEMALLAEDLENARRVANDDHFHEPDQFALEVGADINTAFGKGAILRVDFFDGLLVALEGAALSHGALVVNALDALGEFEIILHFSDLNALLAREPDIASGGLGKPFEPSVISFENDGGLIVDFAREPLKGVARGGCSVRQTEDIGLNPVAAQALDQLARISQVNVLRVVFVLDDRLLEVAAGNGVNLGIAYTNARDFHDISFDADTCRLTTHKYLLEWWLERGMERREF